MNTLRRRQYPAAPAPAAKPGARVRALTDDERRDLEEARRLIDQVLGAAPPPESAAGGPAARRVDARAIYRARQAPR